MKKMKLVTEEDVKNLQSQTGSDLKIDLKKRLNAVKSDSDASVLLSDINQILQSPELSDKNKEELRNFRQKIYDKKKRCHSYNKFQTPIYNNENAGFLASDPDLESSGFSSVSRVSDQGIHRVEPGCMNFDHQKNFVLTKFKNLDWDGILRKFPAIVIFGLCALITMWFVWKQSVPLYESTGFSEPQWCAFGALLMIAGFSLIHALTKSKIVLILCLYASSYEVILIVNGTMKNEIHISQTQVEQNAEVRWLKEQTEHSGQNYKILKARYDNPSSSVFQNSWFKEKHLDQAWQKYSNDQKQLSDKVEKLSSLGSSTERSGMLKILYRLGLVFLCMISIHHLLKIFQSDSKDKKRQNPPQLAAIA